MAICKGAEVPGDDPFPVPADRRPWKVFPTDVSQFIRLNQCQRFLRLRLNEQQCGLDEFRSTGATPQTLPPMLSVSGARFEATIESRVKQAWPDTMDLSRKRQGASPGPHNDVLVDLARHMEPGEVRFVLQPALTARIGNWALSGIADVIRFERDEDGRLDALVVDIKSSADSRVEYRLQVAFYHEMLAAAFRDEDEPIHGIATGVLYRGAGDTGEETAEDVQRRAQAASLFNAPESYLEIVEDPEDFRSVVRDLLTGPRSVAQRATETPFAEIPFHLGSHCDKCVYNEFCMAWADRHDDLSMLPFLSEQEKRALQRHGIATVADVAALKVPGTYDDGTPNLVDLQPAPGKEDLVARLGSAWPVGQRLDELVHRAWRYRLWKGDQHRTRRTIPRKGHGSLPYCSSDHNPNLVRVYIEAQHDFLENRLYLLSALVTAARDGVVTPERRRAVIEWTEAPPDEEAEERLLVGWLEKVIRAASELTEPGEDGVRRAPIHLIFPSRLDQVKLLEALARSASTVLGASGLYDFMTQKAAFDSPILSFLDQEVRDLKNVPTVCQPLHVVAEKFGFRWNEGVEYRDLFRDRLFDYWRKEDAEGDDGKWYVGRARFSGQVPLEYAYAAWDALPEPPLRGPDPFRSYRGIDADTLIGFMRRRLDAMEHVANEFSGNRDTEKTEFELPELGRFRDRARNLAEALDEFVRIERMVTLGAWKQLRLAAPERRALAGETLLVSYSEADQDPETARVNRESVPLWRRGRELEEAFLRDNPGERWAPDAETKKSFKWSTDGQTFRLRLSGEGIDGTLEDVAEICSFRPGDMLIAYPRWTSDLRVPREEREVTMPTAKQLLYGMRVQVAEPGVARGEDGEWTITVTQKAVFGKFQPWVFPGMNVFPWQEGVPYTLDSDPNNWNEYWADQVIQRLKSGGRQTLFDLLERPADGPLPRLPVSGQARTAQARFVDGLRAFADIGLARRFEADKERYIGNWSDEPVLLIQGPPGTGKSFTTGFAVLARAQAALAAGQPFRAILSCKTHAATDVLLESVRDARESLADMRDADPDLFARHFDPRVLLLTLYRLRPKGEQEGIVPLDIDGKKAGQRAMDRFAADGLCVMASTPGTVYRAVKQVHDKLLGGDEATLVVLDEASQMSLPEALMATLPLAPTGQIVVVGDHRQMPPIVKHEWGGERRQTFADYAVYESLFDTLLAREVPVARFQESFRLHRDIAEYLRRAIYRKDDIPFHSRRDWTIAPVRYEDDFVNAVLDHRYPLTVVVHDEVGSQQRNAFERRLIAPAAEALVGQGFDFAKDFGIVVPHRAQRAELQGAMLAMAGDDPDARQRAKAAVDTVERFQGGERRVIVISATESDPGYLLAAGKFLYDPRRLTVALSRGKEKLVLVASRSVFSLFSPDDEVFENTLLWKNLLERACTVRLFDEPVDGVRVEVWGNPPLVE